MSRSSDYAVVRSIDGAYRLDRVTDPYPRPVADIVPVRGRTGLPTGWRLRPRVLMLGSKSRVWATSAEAVASTKFMTPGQARNAVKSAGAKGAA